MESIMQRANLANSQQVSKINLTNVVSYFTCAVALFYTLYFWLNLAEPFIAAINLTFVAAYGAGILLSKYHYYRIAKLWFFSILMLHVFILTTQIFTANSGFHFYYLLLPSGVFLLLDEDETFAKALIMLLGLALFFVCHNYPPQPLVVLSTQAEKLIFASTIIIIMSEIYFVMSIFSKAMSRHEQDLREMATIDPLTGINNRRTFMTVGDEMFAYAKRYQKDFSVILLDIDFFKKINDQYGHLVGDNTLKQVANLLKMQLRSSDVLARYGGEEFVILLPDTDKNSAKELAESLRNAVELLSIEVNTLQTINCTISLGIADNEHGFNSLTELVNCADQALYRAKQNGRNRIEL